MNITAGLDLSLGEFSEVGDTIEEFASENATVVVGTVIDSSMNDELKVTVVATGLGGEALRAPLQVVEAPSKPVGELPDYKELDRPTAQRKSKQASGEKVEPGLGKAAGQDMDYFDIPAFLRRQAD